MKNNFDDISMYLDDIDNYVNSILYFYSCPDKIKKELDLKEILMYLSIVPEIVQDIKNYLYSCSKN